VVTKVSAEMWADAKTQEAEDALAAKQQFQEACQDVTLSCMPEKPAPSTSARGGFTARGLVEAIVSEERTRAAERQALGGIAETALREQQLRDALARHEEGALSKPEFLATVRRIADRDAVRRAIVVLASASDDAALKDHLQIKESPATAAASPPEMSPAAPLIQAPASRWVMSNLELCLPLPPTKRMRSKPESSPAVDEVTERVLAAP